jgi:hypothetical protein
MLGEVDAHRRPEEGVYDLQTVASVFQWIFTWLVALLGIAALGAGGVYYVTGPHMLPGHPFPNIMLLVGVLLMLGVLVFSMGRRKSARKK